jgi:hypothetical protein
VARIAVTVAAGAAMALVAAVPAARPVHAASPSVTAATEKTSLALIDVVVLVDESGSETPQKVADEKTTVGTIVPSLLNQSSRVTVVGFGGVNHDTPNQVPTDVACVPTIASGAANLAYLSSCVGKVHQRTASEGNDTDYAAALGQAMSFLSPSSTATPPSPSGAIKIVLMMTDGAADVSHDAQQYGSDWQLGEQTAISAQLAAARQDGVQVWPLGFGTQIGSGLTEPQALGKLNALAHGGAPAVCDQQHAVNQPHATWVNNPDDAISALDQLYADAACVGVEPKVGTAGKPLILSIPQIASAAAISVARGNPGVTVSFQMPDGQAWTDNSAVSGQDSPVEVLHLYNVTAADVGTWTVRLTAPPDLANQVVRATVFWQGAVRALITANPSSAKLGQQVAVALDVLGPSGPITDPSTLSSMIVRVAVAGNGLSGTVNVPVAAAPGQPGHYTGTFAVPRQPTTVTVTGTAAGYGLYTTQVPATVSVGTQTQGFTATPGFGGQRSVQDGGTVNGQVVFTNQTGSSRQVRLVLVNQSSAHATLTSPGGPVTVASGQPPAVPFTISVAPDSPPGAALLQVQAVDAATGQVYNTAEQYFTVTKPPSWLDRYWWVIVVIVVVIILAFLAWLAAWLARRNRRDVRHLVVTLRRPGTPAGGGLEYEGKWAEAFPFIIRDETSAAPRLDHPPQSATGGVYQVSRAGRGLVRLTTPTGLRPYEIEVGGPGLRLDSGLELSFRDTRHPEWTGSGSGDLVATTAQSGTLSGNAGATLDDWAGSGGWSGTQDWSGSGTPTVTMSPPDPQAGQQSRPDYDPGSTPTETRHQASPPPPPPPTDDPWM